MSDKVQKFGAGAIIIHNNKILLAKRKGSFAAGKWGSMGGHIEFGETPGETAIREAYEELGIKIGNLKFLCCSNILFEGKHHFDVSFTAEIIEGTPHINEPEKIETIGWFDLDKLPEDLFFMIDICLEAYKTGKQYFEVNQSL